MKNGNRGRAPASKGVNRRQFLAASLAATAAVPAMSLPLARPALAQSDPSRTLKFVPHASLSIMDPGFSAAGVTTQHGFHIFDTLYGLDANLRPRPQMAEGHVESDDGRTWDITLREGLRFHDGEPVRAQDCIASLKRWMSRDVFAKDIAGMLDTMEAPEDRKLRIKLRQRLPILPLALGRLSPFVPFIMPERLANTEATTQITEMIGSGPYRFVADEHVVGSRVVYSKFDQYIPRQEAPEGTTGGKVAHFDRIEWQIIPDAATAAAALQAGEVDWWDQVHPDLAPLLAGNSDIEVRRLDPYGYMPLLRFNSTIPPFDNPAMRRALIRMIDQTEYLSAITGGNPSQFQTCHAFFPCGTEYGTPLASDPLAEPDFDAVKRDLAEAGYRGEKVVIVNPSDFPTIAPLGEITFELLKKAGVNVEMVSTDWGGALARVQNRETVEKGGWNIYHSWWGGLAVSFPPVNTMIRGLGAKGWTGWYESADMEAMNSAWLLAESETDRIRIAAQMQELAFREMPSIPLGQFFIDTAHRKSITGLVAPRCVPWNVRRA